MNVKEIIKLAATYLQLDDVLKMSIIGGDEDEPSEQTQKNFDLLFKAVNLVYEEIACDYIPLKHQEIVEVTERNILFSSLDKKIMQVLSLKNMDEQNVKYILFPNYIKVPNGTYLLDYSYIPSVVTVEDNLETFSNKVSERVVSYAVASEYALINGLFDEATTWKKRFEDAIKVVATKKSLIKLPTRGWF
ncbi:MAG: hypothetical protein CVV59_00870 [Tenericutes bacterium HGW-Tenericutes-4]|nr:MAG: hypothetical protein CVV59_00870 [Tenericutes bacterium HGW-Tenericutes-4]